MASVTLPESAKLAQNELVSGLIESVVTVDNFYQHMPFHGIDGNALQYTRENDLGPVATVGVGEDIGPTATAGLNQAERQAAKNAATFNSVTSALTTIMGDAEVNQMLQHTRSKQTDQTGTQIASKAKSAGRKFQDLLINGVAGANNEFAGLLTLVPATQKAGTAASGENLSFEILDELISLVKDKDGQVDYFMMPDRTHRAYLKLLRAQPGANINETITLPNGKEVSVYRGVPIYINDNIPTTQVKGGSAAICTTIFAGTFDDGSQKIGIAGLTAERHMGMVAEDVGISHTKDDHIWRVKWYCGLALFSELGIASADGILN